MNAPSAPRAAALLGAALLCGCARAARPFVIGAKSSPEAELAAELAAAVIEEGLGAPVARKLGLSASACLSLLKSGEIDACPENAGQALASALRQRPSDGGLARAVLGEPAAADLPGELARRWGVRSLPPLGYRTAFALAMRPGHARALDVRSLSDLAAVGRGLRCGFDSEFAERPDGYRAVHREYEADLCSSVTHMSRAAMLQGLSDARVDLVSLRSTDADLGEPGLAMLQDDRGAINAYPASLLLSPKTARRFPGAESRLRALSGKVGDADMRRLVSRLEGRPGAAKELAREFLRERGLLP